jgi:hypothetical protein
MLARLGCGVIALLLALVTSGCGSDEPSTTSPRSTASSEPSPSPSPSPSAGPSLPPGVSAEVPSPPDAVEETKQSAESFALYVAAMAQHAIRIRDATPMFELAQDRAICDSCRGLRTYVKGLRKEKLWEAGGDFAVRRLRVQTTEDGLFTVAGPAVYPRISFVDDSGEQQSKQDASNYLFEADLVWDAAGARWRVQDFSLINKGKK